MALKEQRPCFPPVVTSVWPSNDNNSTDFHALHGSNLEFTPQLGEQQFVIPGANFALRSLMQIDPIPWSSSGARSAAPEKRAFVTYLVEREGKPRVGGHVDRLRQSDAMTPLRKG